MSSSVIQLLVLAGVAVFLILKLRAVLGTREGFEKPTAAIDDARPRPPKREFEVIQGGPDRDIVDHAAEGSAMAKALAAMKQAEPAFQVGAFLGGARSAYELILMAFEKGDLAPVRNYLSDDVNASFEQVIAARVAEGLTIESRFVGLRELALQDATFDDKTREGEITVRFVGELNSVVRDKSGAVVEGSPTAIKRQRDVWTFARRMGVDDPNWQLVATGE